MSKPPVLKLDECLFIEPEGKAKPIKSLANTAYENNIPVVLEIIQKNNKKYKEDYNKVKDTIVGGGNCC